MPASVRPPGHMPGLPLPPPCPRIYGFVKARRGAEARPAVGEFDVSWLPRWISALRNRGEAGPGPTGLRWLGVTHRGASGPASFLCCLAPEDFWVERLQATPWVAHPQPMCVPASPASLLLPTQVPLPGVREPIKVLPSSAALASVPLQPWHLCHPLSGAFSSGS